MASKKRNAVSAKRRVRSSRVKETATQKANRYKRTLSTGKQSNGRKKLTSTQRSYNQGAVDMYNMMTKNRTRRS